MEKYINDLQKMMDEARENHGSLGDLSDGYHTFNELYHHRALLFAAICNSHPHLAWKSKQHHDPSDPMYDGMFIVGIETPDGQATYHYDIDPYWDMFKVPELERAYPWDGHTPSMAVERIYNYISKKPISLSHLEVCDEFTKACDSYLRDPEVLAKIDVHTYYWVDTVEHCLRIGMFTDKKDIELTVSFRFPGATRGYIKVRPWDNDRVTAIKFYDTSYSNAVACYKPEIAELVDQWTGKSLPNLCRLIRAMNGSYLDLTK